MQTNNANFLVSYASLSQLRITISALLLIVEIHTISLYINEITIMTVTDKVTLTR